MSNTGKNRVITDQFYTKDDIAQRCVERFYERYPFYKNIVEPSAGDGALFIIYVALILMEVRISELLI